MSGSGLAAKPGLKTAKTLADAGVKPYRHPATLTNTLRQEEITAKGGRTIHEGLSRAKDQARKCRTQQ
jgi:hypothetical protein